MWLGILKSFWFLSKLNKAQKLVIKEDIKHVLDCCEKKNMFWIFKGLLSIVGKSNLQ